MTTKLYLDKRHLNENGEASLTISLCKHGVTAYHPVGVKLEPIYWDAHRQKLVGHPNQKLLRVFIEDKKTKFDNILMHLEMDGELGGLNLKQIRDKVASIMSPDEDQTLFMPYFKRFAENRRVMDWVLYGKKDG